MAHLAVDLGGNGVKLYLGRIGDGSISIHEVHRFNNRPVERDGRFVWDLDHLLNGVKAGLRKADDEVDIDSVGVDAWGVDFGLLRAGSPLQDPYSYRDPKLTSTLDEITELISRRELFERTGINHWNIPNTLWQLHYLARHESTSLESSDALVMAPQLVQTMLGGEPCAEVTIASTSQMLNPRTKEWETDLLARLDLPTDILPAVERHGTSIGQVDPNILDSTPELVLPASHDTASAVAGLPLSADSPAFLSTGTWFLAGVEVNEPILTDDAFELGASNELGIAGTVRFLTNINGFFLLEECREAWRSAGGTVSYERLVNAARDTPAFGPLVNPDDPLFGTPGDIPERIRTYCEATGQSVPESRGATVRCIMESLVAKTTLMLENLLAVAGTSTDRLHLGGGGVRNDWLCELLAAALDRPVHAGPADATAIGNILAQGLATEEVADLAAGRKIIHETLDIGVYEPDGGREWTTAVGEMESLLNVQVGDS